MKVLLFAGSLRVESLNKKLVKVAKTLVESNKGVETTYVDLQELQFPVYDGDIETKGIPENVLKLAKLVDEASAIIISSPEYNASISSPLKNAIDWVSRVRPMPMTKKHILLLGASPGELGAMRGLIHTKPSFETLGNFVYPSVYGLPKADKAFDEGGLLVDAQRYERLQKLVNEFIVYAQKQS